MLENSTHSVQPSQNLHPEIFHRFCGGLSDHAMKMYSVSILSAQQQPVLTVK